MTRVVFYVNVANRLRFLRQFLHRKVFIPRQTALVYGNEHTLEAVDRELWEENFLPHAYLHGDEDATAPIMLTSETPPPAHTCDILISLAAEVPANFAGRFGAFVDVVTRDEQSKQAGRARYLYFKENGYSPEVIDMGRK